MSRKMIDKVINSIGLSKSELRASFDLAIVEVLRLKDLELFKELITAFATLEEWNGTRPEEINGVGGDQPIISGYDIATIGEAERQNNNEDNGQILAKSPKRNKSKVGKLGNG